MSILLEYQLRIRNAANSADALVVTSVPGGTNPYLADGGAPTGDGETIDPKTGETTFGSYSGEIVDPEIGSSQRLVTSLLEDAGRRAQLGYRVSILEFRIDGGSWQTQINGLLVALRRTERGTWAYTVGDPLHALTVSRMFSPASDTLVTDFLAAWPARGCILGGPIIGGTPDAIGIADLNGWKMRVTTSAPLLGPNEYGLIPIVAYGAPTWEPNPKASTVGVLNIPGLQVEPFQEAINEAASQFGGAPGNGAASPWDTIGDVLENGWAFRGLVVLINDVPWKPLSVADWGMTAAAGNVRTLLVSSNAVGGYAMKVKSDGTKTLADGQEVRVRVLSVLPSEVCPIYLSGHPIDLLIRCFEATGISYSDSACDTMRDLIGHDASMALRITSAPQLAALARTICLRDGIGLRTNDDGEIEPFDARLGRSVNDPILTITDDDVADGSVRAHDFDPGSAVRSILFRSKIFADQKSIPVRRSDQSIVDGVAVIDNELPLETPDADALFGTLEISIDAMLHASKALYPRMRDFLEAAAQRIFDRWGRGEIVAEMTLLRGGVGDSLQLGDEVLVDLPQLPNHNYLLGDNPATPARAMQIVRRTIRAIGYDVKLVDSGASRQPPNTVPTLTIAASTDMPRTVAEVTITNAATLNGAGYGIRLQVAYTTDGSDASANQFTDVLAFAGGEVPTGAIRLPPAVAGVTVQARARSELSGSRPTNWSTPEKITLGGIAAPTEIVATPSVTDASVCLLEWTPANTTDLVDIWLRKDGEAFTSATRVVTLEAGSNRYLLGGLNATTDYIATVQHRDPTTHNVSDPADGDVPFTAGSTIRTLTAPTRPRGFSGGFPGGPKKVKLTALLLAQYGIAVKASEIPGEVEVYQAKETASDSGMYGAWETAGVVPSQSDKDWTQWAGLSPNDGLRRKLRARHIADGCTPSPWTPAVVVSPWVYAPFVDDDTDIELQDMKTTDAADGSTRTFTATCPAGVAVVVLWVIRRSVGLTTDPWPPSDPAALEAWRAAGNGELHFLTPSSDTRQVSYVLEMPDETQEAFLQFEPRTPDWDVGPVRRFEVFALPTIAIPQGTVTVDEDGAYHWQEDGPAAQSFVRYAESTSDYPDEDTTAASGTVFGGRQVIVDGAAPLSFGQSIYITIIPFTASGVRMNAIRLRGAYLTYQATKQATFGLRAFSPEGPGSVTMIFVNGNARANAAGYPAGLSVIVWPVLPPGCEITDLEMECNMRVGTTVASEVRVDLYTGLGTTTPTIVAQGYGTPNLGWQLVEAVFSDTVGTGDDISFVVALFAESAAADVEAAYVRVTYIMPQPDKTL